MRSTRAGLTLIELLVAATMSAVIAAALSKAFYTVVRYEINAPAQRDAADTRDRFEDRLRTILQAAYLSPTATDLSTYLIGTSAGQNPNGSPNLAAAQAAPGSAAATTATTTANTANSNTAAPSTGGNSDGIVLTCLGGQIPPNYLQVSGVQLTDDATQDTPTGGSQNFQQQQNLPNGEAIEQDLQTLNTDYGPQGGIAEISITNTPVGDPGQFPNDVYMRVQRPADADYTQGGKEQVFDPGIQKMQFEFFDGLQWDGTWDTTSTGQRHLPAAIRVHYWLKSEPDNEYIFVVRIPLSDLTPSNPISATSTTSTVGGTATGGGGATTGGTGGRAGVAPAALSGTLPMFSNVQIVPDAQSDQADSGLIDKSALLAPDSLEALSTAVPKPAEPVQQPPVPDWRKTPGKFAYVPQQDPILAPVSPAQPIVKPIVVKNPTPKLIPKIKVGPQ